MEVCLEDDFNISVANHSASIAWKAKYIICGASDYEASKWQSKDKMEGELEGRHAHYGLLRQGIEAVYPDLVVTDSAGYKSVTYQGFIPIQIELVTEQESEIADFNKINSEVQKEW